MNKRNQTIKQMLLKEATRHVTAVKIKKASIDKQASPNYVGRDYGRKKNIQQKPLLKGGHVQEIYDSVHQRLNAFMKTRVHPIEDDVVTTEGPRPRGKRMVLMVPQNVPNTETAYAPNVDPKQIAAFGDVDLPENAHGCLYYRYGISRTILPDVAYQKERERVKDVIAILERNIGKPGAIHDLINQLESSRIPVLPSFNVTEVPSYRAEPFVISESEKSPGLNPLKKSILDFYDNGYHQLRSNPAPISVGNRHTPLPVSTDRKQREDVSPQLKRITNDFALVRMIWHKIAAGYTLNEKGLMNTVGRRLVIDVAKEKREQREVTSDQFDMMRGRWNQQYKQMVCAFQFIRLDVFRQTANEKEYQRELRHVQSTCKMSPPRRLEDMMDKAGDHWYQHGLEWMGKKGGKVNPRKMSPKFGDPNIPFNYVHLQMVLQNINKEDPGIRIDVQEIKNLPQSVRDKLRKSQQIGANQVSDPDAALHYWSDGISDHSSVQVANQGLKSFMVTPLMNKTLGQLATEMQRHGDAQGADQLREFDVPRKKTQQSVKSVLERFGKMVKTLEDSRIAPNIAQEINSQADTVIREFDMLSSQIQELADHSITIEPNKLAQIRSALKTAYDQLEKSKEHLSSATTIDFNSRPKLYLASLKASRTALGNVHSSLNIGFVDYNRRNVNLGTMHLTDHGTDILQLLIGNPWVADAMKLLQDNKQQVIAGIRDPTVQTMVNRHLSNYHLGHDIFSDFISQIQTGSDLQPHLETKRHGRTFPSDDQSLNILKTIGPAMSRMMGLIFGIVYACDHKEVPMEDGVRTLFGQDTTTSAGIGGGSEILLSVRYAYTIGTDNVKDQYRKQLKQSRKDIGLRTGKETFTAPGIQTEHFAPRHEQPINTETGETNVIGDLINDKSADLVYISKFEYFVGQASSLRSDQNQKMSMFHDVSPVRHSWEDALAEMQRMYTVGGVSIDEAAGHVIGQIRPDLKEIEAAIHGAVIRAREQIASESQIEPAPLLKVVDSDGREQVAAAQESLEESGNDNVRNISDQIKMPTPEPTQTPAQEFPGIVTPPQIPSPGQRPETPQIFPTQTPATETEMPDIPQAPVIDKDTGKGMLRQMGPASRVRKSSIKEQLVKLSNDLDQKGITQLSDKLDQLTQKYIQLANRC